MALSELLPGSDFGGAKTDEVVSGNGAGDARLHPRLHYRVRNLDC